MAACARKRVAGPAVARRGFRCCLFQPLSGAACARPARRRSERAHEPEERGGDEGVACCARLFPSRCLSRQMRAPSCVRMDAREAARARLAACACAQSRALYRFAPRKRFADERSQPAAQQRARAVCAYRLLSEATGARGTSSSVARTWPPCGAELRAVELRPVHSQRSRCATFARPSVPKQEKIRPTVCEAIKIPARCAAAARAERGPRRGRAIRRARRASDVISRSASSAVRMCREAQEHDVRAFKP